MRAVMAVLLSLLALQASAGATCLICHLTQPTVLHVGTVTRTLGSQISSQFLSSICSCLFLLVCAHCVRRKRRENPLRIYKWTFSLLSCSVHSFIKPE